jgi:hypothetical protein
MLIPTTGVNLHENNRFLQNYCTTKPFLCRNSVVLLKHFHKAHFKNRSINFKNGICHRKKDFFRGVKTFYFVINFNGSRVSSGSIVSDYGLDDRAIEVRFSAGAKDFSCSLCVQTGSGAHPASCPMGTGVLFPGGKSAVGAWRWPLTPI